MNRNTATFDELELAIASLIQEPHHRERRNQLVVLLRSLATTLTTSNPDIARLSRALSLSCAQCIEGVQVGVDVGSAIPLVASACATINMSLCAQVGDSTYLRPLEAAHYEIETLLPKPGAGIDVSVGNLRRKPNIRPLQ